MSTSTYPLLVTCPKGVEGLLADELSSLGAVLEREQPGGMRVQAALDAIYRLGLWSRLANRLLLPLAAFEVDDANQLYTAALAVDWPALFPVSCSIAVDAQGTNRALRHTHFAALRVKDAVVDRFRADVGERPSVDRKQPDMLIQLRIRGRRAELFLDLVGDSLHRRGYRLEGAAAPLKENLAAALLIRSDWPGMAARGGGLVDPMCGSGTLLIEAALMAMGIAPGLQRKRWSFSHWCAHRADRWQTALQAAQAARQQALSRDPIGIYGYDANADALRAARHNVERAGLTGFIHIEGRQLAHLTRPMAAGSAASTASPPSGPVTGLLICNPPYGERLGDVDSLRPLYACLGERLRSQFQGYAAAVFTGNPELGKHMGLRSHKQYRLYNGALPSQLLLFQVQPEAFVNAPPPLPDTRSREGASPSGSAAAESAAPLSSGAAMLANRLRKNRKRLARWLQREAIDCYRLYDADMPEYAVAIDIYGDQVHIAEYAPPASVDADAALARLQEVLAAVADVLAMDPRDIVLKQRSRQRGSDQYQRREQRGSELCVREGSAQLRVNLTDYLDTGLFLDHRPVRRWIHDWAGGKRFLNLFCYTATATVQAGLGGALASTSVDLSSTYLDWARRNLAQNGLSEHQHQLVRADCREWLEQCRDRYDLILLDPPTFSNSKRMEGVLDVQRDHVQLINAALQRLAPGGTLIFSTNLRRFQLDSARLQASQVEDVTRASLDPDFERSKGIHQCWLLRA